MHEHHFVVVRVPAFVATLNRGLGELLDKLLLPLDRLAPIAGLAAVSVLVAIGMLLTFKATSDGKGLP